MTSKTLRIGRNRDAARIWIEGQALAVNGWTKGTRYNAEFHDGSITYTRNPEGSRAVAGDAKRPIIDTNTNAILQSLGDDATHAHLAIAAESITITRGKAPGILGAVAGAVATLAVIAAPYISQFKQGAMRVLVACEESATVRDAFAARGHDAVSCDVLDTRNPYGFHIKGDVTPYLSHEWDLVIGFPPCTYGVLSASWAFKDPDFEKYPDKGGYHMRVKPGTLTGEARRAARLEAIDFMEAIWQSADKVCIENPKGFFGTMWRPYTQVIQPFEHGHPESKETCLWLKGLPHLEPTNVLDITKHGKLTDKGWRWLNQTASGQSNLGPSADRAKIRSTTYRGVGEAMAAAWG